MTFIEQWREQLPESLGAFVQRAKDAKDIDLLSGVLPVGVLWPIRHQVQAYDDEAAAAVRAIVGVGAGRVLTAVSVWSDDWVAEARNLAAQAEQDPNVRAALARLVEHFDATRLFAEQLASRYAARSGGDTFNISEQIKAALVNIGGVTNIEQLTVELNLPLPAEAISARQRWLLYAVGVVALVSAVVGIYSGIVSAVSTPSIPTPAPPAPTPVKLMNGNVNVAVAMFGAIDNQGHVITSTEASRLAEQVYVQLNKELEKLGSSAGIIIEVRPPIQTGPISGTTRAMRVQAAEALSQAILADVIVYGNLEAGATAFVPEFYLSDRQLTDAEELTGRYELGDRIQSDLPIDSNPVAAALMREALLRRTKPLAQFWIALGYYGLDRFDQANSTFTSIERAADWIDHDGKEVLYLFLGNTYLKLGDLDAALTAYERALKIKPDYARAQMGVAEILFQRAGARVDCVPKKVDGPGLQEAARRFEAILNAQESEVPYIHTKAALFQGRVYLCQGQAHGQGQALGADYWGAARTAFQRVITDFDKEGKRLQNFAAEAHAGLGLICALTGSGPAGQDGNHCGIEEFEQAAKLTSHEDRRAFFYAWVAHLSVRAQAYTEADQALAQADNAYNRFINEQKQKPNAKYEDFRRKVQQERAGAPSESRVTQPAGS